jgi:hypothetical protein
MDIVEWLYPTPPTDIGHELSPKRGTPRWTRIQTISTDRFETL